MDFRTEYSPRRRGFSLDPRRPVVLIGSCFTENIGAKMTDALWDAHVNPCGILFNPLSIARTISLAFSGEPPRIAQAGGKTFSWDFPTSFQSEDVCRQALLNLKRRLQEAQALIVTFGTANVYFHDGEVVANCHKMPASLFESRIAELEEMKQAWETLISQVLPSHLKLIFTVSPVRHVKDGMAKNSLSKASLRLLCHRLIEEWSGKTEYFPAFEIMNDDLRDYRFYGNDMIHPSDTAVEYLWQIFRKEFLTPEGDTRIKEGETISRRLRHRFLFPDSPEAVAFQKETDRLLQDFRR